MLDAGTIDATTPLQISGPIAKKLRWKMQAGETVERTLITPEIAHEMLKYNEPTDALRNRGLAFVTINTLAQAMTEGRWHFTGDTIKFSRGMRLLDGQHRLMAVIASGVAIDVLVAYGLPDETFAYIDIGKKRTTGDIFHIEGIPNSALMAAAVKFVVGYENGWFSKASIGNLSELIDNAGLVDAYRARLDIQQSAGIGHLFAKCKLAPPAIMTGVHYLCAQKSRAKADEFFTSVATGEELKAKSPAFQLRKRLMTNVVEHERLGRKTMAAFAIKGWNAFRSGQEIRIFKFAADESFPRVV